jgi:hypothetical protein
MSIGERGGCKGKNREVKIRIMEESNKNQANSVIDNSKNFQVITHSLYLVANPKTGEIKQECRTERTK